MIKFLLLILLGFVGYSMVQGIIRPKQKRGGKTPRNRSRDGEKMVEDPQCGTFLPISDAFAANINGQEHFFCSKECLKKFKKAQ